MQPRTEQNQSAAGLRQTERLRTQDTGVVCQQSIGAAALLSPLSQPSRVITYHSGPLSATRCQLGYRLYVTLARYASITIPHCCCCCSLYYLSHRPTEPDGLRHRLGHRQATSSRLNSGSVATLVAEREARQLVSISQAVEKMEQVKRQSERRLVGVRKN